MKNGIIAAASAAAVSSISVLIFGVLKWFDLGVVGTVFEVITVVGSGIIFAAELALAGRVAGLQGPSQRVPWLAMGCGPPVTSVVSLCIVALLPLHSEVTDQHLPVRFHALVALLLLTAVSRTRSGRWSFGGLACMTFASVAWAVLFGTQLRYRWFSNIDTFWVASVATWQVLFSFGYAWWVWPLRPRGTVQPGVAADEPAAGAPLNA
jgi:hypothetical protein